MNFCGFDLDKSFFFFQKFIKNGGFPLHFSQIGQLSSRSIVFKRFFSTKWCLQVVFSDLKFHRLYNIVQ